MNPTSEAEVKKYLACWFQLGKKIIGAQQTLFPEPIFRGHDYSPEFERCWQEIITAPERDFYLEGTDYTIGELLSPAWEILPCSRCEMPIALKTGQVTSPLCPCNDLPDWPNTELPKPRIPADSRAQLQRLRDRLSTSTYKG